MPAENDNVPKGTTNLAVDDKIKVIEIEPAGSSSFDSIIFEAGNSWAECLHQIELSLDSQWREIEDGDKEWTDITVAVKCREMTRAQVDEIPRDY